jgi:tetratricopeptide (TPR) repeat protein
VNAAEFMGEEKLGSVKQGYQADLLLLDENPLEDIRNIEKLKGIFLRGRWYPKNDIEEKLKRVSDTYHEQEIELNARQATTDLFMDALDTSNVDSVISVFKQIDEDVPTSLFGESELNSLGYQLLSQDKAAEAIKIFKLNTELYPESANVWDSLGEGYWKKGEIEKAIESYEYALRINPQFENAKRALKELREI